MNISTTWSPLRESFTLSIYQIAPAQVSLPCVKTPRALPIYDWKTLNCSIPIKGRKMTAASSVKSASGA